jgi:hypothetical protein
MKRLLLLAFAVTTLLVAEPIPYSPDSAWRGVWLRNDHTEAFVTTSPRIRLLHLATTGESTLLRTAEDDVSGLKTGFREPGHTPLSFAVGDQPGRITEQTDTRVTIESPVHPGAGLALRLTVDLLPDIPGVRVTHTLINHAPDKRRLAVWSLAAVPRHGTVDIPFPPGATLQHHQGPAPRIETGHLHFDLNQDLAPYIANQTIHSPIPHWILRHRTRVLHSFTSLEGEEPNLIVYQDASPPERFAELEHIGPLTTVASGESVSLTQHLHLNPPNLIPNAPRDTLVFDEDHGRWTAPDGTLQAWEGRFGPQPVFLGENGELPRISGQQYPPEKIERRIELTFTPPENPAKTEVLLELGGRGNGVSLYLEDQHLHACAWGTVDGKLTLVHDSLPLPDTPDPLSATLTLHHSKGFQLRLNQRFTRRHPLPEIQSHRSPSALGGVARDARTRLGVLKTDEASFQGRILSFFLQLDPGGASRRIR